MNDTEIVETRKVTDLETTRALMEPLRLAILRTLTLRGPRRLTAKQIAEELDEGQTKLYRHIKQLEEHGLIHVAETRVVSGIIEKRYAASQRRLTIDRDVLGLADADPEGAAGHLTAPLDAAREYLLTELRAGRVMFRAPQEGPDLRYHGVYTSIRVRPEDYEELWQRVSALTAEYNSREAGQDVEGTVPMMFQAMMFAVNESAGGPAPESDPAGA